MKRIPYKLVNADVLEALSQMESESVQCVITSPPYCLTRDYEADRSLGFQQTPEEYIQGLVSVFREVRRVLRPDGVLWLNTGDAYAEERSGRHMPSKRYSDRGCLNANGNIGSSGCGQGTKAAVSNSVCKEQTHLPWRVASALRDDGWCILSEVIRQKQNPAHANAKDCHDGYISMLAVSHTYYYDSVAVEEDIKENLRTGNLTSFWMSSSEGDDPDSCLCSWPLEFPETCIKASTRPGDIVLDPFCGSGDIGVSAIRLDRRFIGIDFREEYIELAKSELADVHSRIYS